MKHWRPGNKAILLGRPQIHAQQRHARYLGAVADQRALGQAGRAAGVENDEPVFGIDIRTFRRRRRGPDHLLVVILDNQAFGIAQLQRGQRFGESPRADYKRGRD